MLGWVGEGDVFAELEAGCVCVSRHRILMRVQLDLGLVLDILQPIG